MGHDVMQLIVGLGNPGEKYRRNRHNIGFMVLEQLAARWDISFGTAAPTYWQAAHTAARTDLVLLKPRTYMNRSGQAVLDWACRNDREVTGCPRAETTPVADDAVEPAAPVGIRPLVICDDLNLPLGSLRLRRRGSAGGQNGLLSVIDCLGGEEFPRMRLGIAPVGAEIPPAQWPDYVLADFTAAEAAVAAELVEHACAAVECWLDSGLESAISRFNRRIRPVEPADD